MVVGLTNHFPYVYARYVVVSNVVDIVRSSAYREYLYGFDIVMRHALFDGLTYSLEQFHDVYEEKYEILANGK